MSQKIGSRYSIESSDQQQRPERRTSERRVSEINKTMTRLTEAIEQMRLPHKDDQGQQDRIELTGELPGGMKGSAKAPGQYIHVLALCLIASALAYIGITVKSHHDATQNSSEQIAKAINYMSEVMRMQVCFSTLSFEERVAEFKYPSGRCKMAGDK